MLFQLILSILIGISFGIFTGLIPGIHINLVGVFLVSLSSKFFSSINSIYLIVFTSSMAITHTFLDFIPSIFLGCPDTDTELSILPGHQMLKSGFGYEAILLTAYGSISAIIILLIISLPSAVLIPLIYKKISTLIPFILILISISLILMEKKKLRAIFVFSLTGILGILIFNLNLKEPLLPLLSGLFGGSMLVISLKNKTNIPKQNPPSKIKPRLLKPLTGAILSAPLCSFLPGLGSGQAAVIGNLISRTDRKGFLVLLGATNTLVMGFSFISLYSISKTRTGAAVASQKIIGTLAPKTLVLILSSILISGIISFFLTLEIAKIFSKKIEKIDYSFLSLLTLLFLSILTTVISGFLGIIVLMTSTLTGILCISTNVKRTNMMGCLLVPVILSSLF